MYINRTEANRIESILGKRVVASRPVEGGYTPAKRTVLGFADGSSLFAKIATNVLTAGWLRQEKTVYGLLNGTFMPRVHGWHDDGQHPILLLEDFSHAYWPPPWENRRITQIIETLTRVAQCQVPDLPRLSAYSDLSEGWRAAALPG